MATHLTRLGTQRSGSTRPRESWSTSHYGTFPLLTGTPDALRPLLAPGAGLLELASGETIEL